MNRAGNERFRETEKALTDAFLELLEEKELSEITVSELCRRCGIHRSSFYLHFADIYAMMERIEEDLADYYGKLFGTGREDYDLPDRFIRFFSFIQSHKSFYKVYWFRSSDLSVLNAALPEDNREAVRRLAGERGIRGYAGLSPGFFQGGPCSPDRTLADQGLQGNTGRTYADPQRRVRKKVNNKKFFVCDIEKGPL